MNKGHVPAPVLAAYADGSLDDGMCLIVAGHLTFCPRCREHLNRLEALGGALLVEPAAGCCAKPDLARILSRLDGPDVPMPDPEPAVVAPVIEIPAGTRPCAAIDHLPRCLRERLGSALTAIGWREKAPGLSVVPVPIDGPGTLRLFRAEAGARLPEHEHQSPGAALLLRGTLREGDRTFQRGDLIFSRTGDRHAPLIGDACPCVLLILDGDQAREFMPDAPSSPA